MNLALDFGNSFVKAGWFDGEKLVRTEEQLSYETAVEYGRSHGSDPMVIASVTKDAGEIIADIGNKEILVVDHRISTPLSMKYLTPETLGIDRLAAAVGGNHLFPGKNILVIDLGTAITYDFVDDAGNFYGGAISPGLRLKLNALNTYTSNLPLIELKEHPDLIGRSTEGSIGSGVFNGTVAEIQGIIYRYLNKFADLQVIMCGGDCRVFEPLIKTPIHVIPELVLMGLNIILNYNENK